MLRYNGEIWSAEDLKLLASYKNKVRVEHLEKLIPNQTAFDITRKIAQMEELGVGTRVSVEELLSEVKNNG